MRAASPSVSICIVASCARKRRQALAEGLAQMLEARSC